MIVLERQFDALDPVDCSEQIVTELGWLAPFRDDPFGHPAADAAVHDRHRNGDDVKMQVVAMSRSCRQNLEARMPVLHV